MAGGIAARKPSPRRGSEHSPLLMRPPALAATMTMARTSAATVCAYRGPGAMLGPVKNPPTYAIETRRASITRVIATSAYGSIDFDHLGSRQQLDSDEDEDHARRIFGSGCMKKHRACDPADDGRQSNQSETESDSDGSFSLAVTVVAPAPPKSILRIGSATDASGRRLEKKHSSVEFALEVDDTEEEEDSNDDSDAYVDTEVNDENEASARGLRGRPTKRNDLTDDRRRKSCASRCVPRRLTIEEKAALYRVRPDLEFTPAPMLIRDAEEHRRRRQRRLVFSVLGGTLVLLAMVVVYYVLTQV